MGIQKNPRTYRAKETVEALQWDGTAEHAKFIQQWLEDNTFRYGVEYGQGGQPYIAYGNFADQRKLYKHGWVVKVAGEAARGYNEHEGFLLYHELAHREIDDPVNRYPWSYTS